MRERIASDEFWPDEMAHAKLQFTLNQVDKAGVCMIDRAAAPDAVQAAFDAMLNWRSAHSYPLNALHMTLRYRAKQVDPQAITAQRLKRYDSIYRKIARFPRMQLSQMQDVGGCRAIVRGMRQLNRLVDIYETRPFRHEAKRPKNYVLEPKEDGYRGVHLIYRFCGAGPSAAWDKLKIEIQLRTKLQHAWATAVETVDTYREGELKFGGGSERWRRFFQLAGSAHALMENTKAVPGTPYFAGDLKREILELEKELDVFAALRSWSMITKHISGIKKGKNYWYFIEIRPDKQQAFIQSFGVDATQQAHNVYARAEIEARGTRRQAVLVSINSLSNLQKAYPNYFADTEMFTSSLRHFLEQPL